MQVFVDWFKPQTRPEWMDWLIEDGIGAILLAAFVVAGVGSLLAIPVLYALGY